MNLEVFSNLNDSMFYFPCSLFVLPHALSSRFYTHFHTGSSSPLEIT